MPAVIASAVTSPPVVFLPSVIRSGEEVDEGELALPPLVPDCDCDADEEEEEEEDSSPEARSEDRSLPVLVPLSLLLLLCPNAERMLSVSNKLERRTSKVSLGCS